MRAEYAKSLGSVTVSDCRDPNSMMANIVDIAIDTVVEIESTDWFESLKIRHRQKLVLNMLYYGYNDFNGQNAIKNLMVDVQASNEKLKARAIRIVMQATDCDKTSQKRFIKTCRSKCEIRKYDDFEWTRSCSSKALLEKHQASYSLR